MSVLEVEFVSCIQQKSGSCFPIYFLSLCSFIGDLGPLILIAINVQWMLLSLLFHFEWLCAPFLRFCLCEVISFFFCVCEVSFLVLGFSFQYFLCFWICGYILFQSGFVTEYFFSCIDICACINENEKVVSCGNQLLG